MASVYNYFLPLFIDPLLSMFGGWFGVCYVKGMDGQAVGEWWMDEWMEGCLTRWMLDVWMFGVNGWMMGDGCLDG